MDTKEKIESFRKRITERIFQEYTRNGTVSSRVYILGVHGSDGYVIGFRNIPGILHLEGDEFEKGYIMYQMRTDQFIRKFREEGNHPLCVCQTESGFNEEEDCDNISIIFSTGEKLDESDVLHYRVDGRPMYVNEGGGLVMIPPRFTKVSQPWTDQ